MDEYQGRENRRNWRLTEEEMEAIVERAAERAAKRATDLVFDKLYQEIGKGVFARALTVILVCVGMISTYLAGKGFFK